MIPEENLNLPVFRNCTWSWHHLNREVGAATPWIRGPLAHAVRDAHFAHLPPVPILGAVHARDLDLGSGKLVGRIPSGELAVDGSGVLMLSWDDDGSALLHLVAVMHERNVYM